jgi:HD-like signal output (HDOD) protein
VRKHVLIVDDEPEHFAHFSEALVGLCPDWELAFVKSCEEAMSHLEAYPCDAVVADMNMPEITGAQLLNEVSKWYPKTLRLITASSMNKEMVMKCVLGAYEFLPKPCEPEALRDAVVRAFTLDQLIGDEDMKRLVSRIRTFPSIPSLYFEVLKELRNPDASSERIGEIIARDLAMSTKVLQALNSAFYALPRQITDPTEAVNILGFEMVKSLVLCIQVYSQFDKVKPYYFSIDRLWRHSTAVAQVARKIAYQEGLGSEIADEAYTAGLLHDIGKLVLVTNFEGEYKKVQQLEQTDKKPHWEAEKIVFGASHAEVGAYLIGNWGMPVSLAETTCYHHCPSRSEKKEFNSLTLVHAANSLIYESQPKEGVQPVIDETYMAELGLEGHTKMWRDMIAKSKAENQEVRKSGPLRDYQREESRKTGTPKSAIQPPKSGKKLVLWAFVGAGLVGVVIGLLVWKFHLFGN